MQIVTNQFQKELKKHGSDEFPVLVSYERLSKYESGSFLWHWHPEIEVTFVQSGEMIYKVNQCTFHLKAGDVLIGNTNVLHAGFMYQQRDCSYVPITFDPKLLYGFRQSVVCRKYVEPFLQDFSIPAIHMDGTCAWHEEVIRDVKAIIDLSEEKGDFYEMDMISHLQALWRKILAHKCPVVSYTARDKMEHERIKEILNYLEKNYMNHISLKDISEHIHLCESECSRLFKRNMNVSLFVFLQEYRIERSLELLGDDSLSITEVAVGSGFSDSNYYSKVFAKMKGCSPLKYRKEMEKK